MNTKEKKKLKHKYVKHIKDCISNFDTLFKDDEIDISYFEELLMYAELSDHNIFYDHHEKFNWPYKTSHVREYRCSMEPNSDSLILELRKDKILNRIVNLKYLGI